MSRPKLLYRFAGDFLSLLFPRLCQCCGEHLVRNEEIICTACLLDMPVTGFHKKRNNELERSLWGRCYVERAAAYAFYQRGGKMQALVHRLKYLGITAIGSYLGKMYGTLLKESGFLDNIDLIVPVPLHPSKERRRGFNQSLVIANGISVASGIAVETRLLRRIKKTATQTRKSRVERWENVEDIFDYTGTGITGVNHLLLVDDVITTGSTIEACVNAIKGSSPDVKVSVASLAAAAVWVT